MAAVNLEEALKLGNGRRHGLSAEAKKEAARRSTAATNLARQALHNLHREEHGDLYQQALAKIYAERGPLPGKET